MKGNTSDHWFSGRGGLLKTDLHDPSGARVEIYRHGAHVTAWRSAAGNDWIFTSELAKFDGASAVRGGVPIIFPQFNEFGSGPRHGFARNLEWKMAEHGGNQLTLFLESNEATKVWPHQFRAEFAVAVKSTSLSMTLTVANTSTTTFEFTCALHSYFKVHSLSTCRVTGVTGLAYWDNDGSDFRQRAKFESSHLSFDDAVDRVFFNYQEPLVLHNDKQQLRIEHSGFQDIVVWNPGRAAAQSMSDFADYEYNHMLCIEAAQIDCPVVLEPGESWRGSQCCIDSDHVGVQNS